MPLTEAENSYFKNLAFQRKHKIDRKFQDAMDMPAALDDESIRHLVCLQRVKDYAKETIDSRVDTYIETCKKYEKYPNEADLAAFSEEAKPYVLNKKSRFTDYCTGLNGPNISESVFKAIVHTLSFDLQSIFREALFPLESFYLEGKVREEQLIEQEKRNLEVNQNIEVAKEYDTNPLILKPSIWGIGIDLLKAWHWIKKLFGKKKH